MQDYVIAEPAADVDGAPVIVNVNEPVEQFLSRSSKTGRMR